MFLNSKQSNSNFKYYYNDNYLSSDQTNFSTA